MAFQKFLFKRPKKQALDLFWKEYNAGERVRKSIKRGERIKAIAITPTIVATPRKFRNKKDLVKYIRKIKLIEKEIKKAAPKIFELCPARFLGAKADTLLECAYPAPDLLHLMAQPITRWHITELKKESRYRLRFIRRIEKKGVKWGAIEEQIREDAKKVVNEVKQIIKDRGLQFDFGPSNIIALDYDPHRRKFLITIIDIIGATL